MNNKEYVINDPIHQLIYLGDKKDKFLLPFINHPYIQRLRYIKQMGLADLIFPSAVHNRFSHSLGAATVAHKMAQKLHLNDRDSLLLAIGGLLHDIGHGPFSHAFEKLFDIIGGIKHEQWTTYFIRAFKEDIFLDGYNSANPRHTLTNQDIDKLENILSATNKNVYTDILSSQLDCDRLDYLLRDSHFCGVKYGYFDIDWLINSIEPYTDGSGEIRLAISSKGIATAEQYLLARNQMNIKIYSHHAIVAMECLLIKLMISIVNRITQNFQFPEPISTTPIFSFLSILSSSIKTKNKNYFMEESFSIYQKLCDFDIYYIIKEIYLNKKSLQEAPEIVSIASDIYTRNIPVCVPIPPENMPAIRTEVKEMHASNTFADWQICIIENNNIFYQDNDNPIKVKQNNAIVNIESISPLVKNAKQMNSQCKFLFFLRNISDTMSIKKLVKCL